jgi:hypothetical protein
MRPHHPRPALDPGFIQGLLVPQPDATERALRRSIRPSDPRVTMEVNADTELLPDSSPESDLPSSPPSSTDSDGEDYRAPEESLDDAPPLATLRQETRTTIEVDAEHDLLNDASRPLDDARVEAAHVDVAALGTTHHPLSAAPMTTEVVAHDKPRTGGVWLLAAGALIVVLPIVFGARTPPTPATPPAAAAAMGLGKIGGAPATAKPRATTDLATQFEFMQLDADAWRAHRELALDPVHIVTSNEPAPAPKKKETSEKAAFDPTMARAAIASAGLGPSQCGESAAGATVVSVTFAPSGHVTRALVEDGPLQGTAVGGCVARHLRDVSVPAFDGDFQTIRTDLVLK